MYAEERQQEILRVAPRPRAGWMSLTLAEEFEVTTETIRRDLTALERAGRAAAGARRGDPGRADRFRARAVPPATRC